MSTIDSILTADEVAKELRISKSQVHKLLRGEVENVKPLPSISVGRRKVVPRSALERWKRESVSDMIPSQSEKNAADASKGVH
jgi:hypothetical protein